MDQQQTYVYEVRCQAEACDRVLGEISFQAPRTDWNPKTAGLMCGPCARARREASGGA